MLRRTSIRRSPNSDSAVTLRTAAPTELQVGAGCGLSHHLNIHITSAVDGFCAQPEGLKSTSLVLWVAVVR